MGIPVTAPIGRRELSRDQLEQVPGLPPEHEWPGAQAPFDEQLAKQTRFVPSHLYGVQSVVLWTHWPSPLQADVTSDVDP
jgi:hypothetical protein